MSAPELRGDVIESFKNLDLNVMKKEIEKNKGGIEISELKFVDQNGYAELAVVNKSTVPRTLNNITIMSSCEGTFQLVENFTGIILPFEVKIVSISCQPPSPGIYRGIICFQFTGFGIGRYAKFNYGDEVLAKALAPTSAYVKIKRHQKRTPRKHIIAAESGPQDVFIEYSCDFSIIQRLAMNSARKQVVAIWNGGKEKIYRYDDVPEHLERQIKQSETTRGASMNQVKAASVCTIIDVFPDVFTPTETNFSASARRLSPFPKTKQSMTAFNHNIETYTAFLETLRSQFQNHLDTHNGEVDMNLYFRLYEGLLNIEELQLGDDIHIFDMHNVSMRKVGNLLALTVDGLAEKRPSVLVGDIIHAHLSGDVSDSKYEGHVERIEQNEVFLRFHNSLASRSTRSMRYDVQFTVNRRTWKTLLQGVSLAAKKQDKFLGKFLFPVDVAPTVAPADSAGDDSLYGAVTSWFGGTSSSVDALSSQMSSLSFANSDLNAQQQSAVKQILSGRGHVAPYIIFGPPGTGKTVTIVRTIEHFFSLPDNSRKHILVCAPSNTAADLLVERLAETFTPTQMHRLMSYMRNPNDVTATVKKYVHGRGPFESPPIDDLAKFRVVVATCMMAAKLYNLGLGEGHFDVVFVDESGHTWEPEILATFVSSMNRHTGQLVLAGDPKQLGPITHNRAADVCGLGLSLLERLIGRPTYSRDVTLHPQTNGYNPLYITKLVNCYRCHPDIIRLPNALFYEGDLVPMADKRVSDNLCAWSGLPRQGFPLIFHGVEGECQQEATSPSWFNISEVEIVIKYVKSLTSSAQRVKPSEIGIITPYARQVKKIKQALLLNGISDCMVGSCEQLQGQERRGIIISTVRSSSDYSSYDVKYNLGFVASPKRFNVAVTRAQALLIVVGSPKMLRGDENWNALLQYCINQRAYVGVPLGSNTGSSGGAGGSDGTSPAAAAENASRFLSLLNNMRRDPAASSVAADLEEQDVEDYDMADYDEE